MTVIEKTEIPTVFDGDDESEDGRLSDLAFSDALTRMRDRCFGLEAATKYLNQDDMSNGIKQLAADLSNAMDGLAKAFEAERQLRNEERR